jgi:hypothetical protein
MTEEQKAAVVDRATGLALQANSAAAAEALARLPADTLDQEAAAFRRCMIERFGPRTAGPQPPGVADPWLEELVNGFVTYWQHVLTKSHALEEAESELRQRLRTLAGRSGGATERPDEMESELQAEIRRRGCYALMGRTLPLLELMLWRAQVTAAVVVGLPEGEQPLLVTYLDDFVLRGWGHYATCGRRSTGGWATASSLFAVVPAYKRLDDETFTVRFLAHEAQHSLDLQRFGAFEGWELEYRAKLTELTLAHYTQAETLRRLCENRSDGDKQAPHAYAKFAVIRDLEQRLASHPHSFNLCGEGVSDEAAIRAAAKALLLADSGRRAATPAAK